MAAFHVIGADSRAAKENVAAAGLDGVLVQSGWDSLQPNGAGSALQQSSVDWLNGAIDDCRALGLVPSFEFALQYPPAWVLGQVERFRDQSGLDWSSTDPGKQVRNWMWTANGRALVADLLTKVRTALTVENREAIGFMKLGGGYYGELQYPVDFLSSPISYWGYGASMQTGTGLAAGLEACPLPGYQVFSGTDAQDVQWINWYLRGIEDWMLWKIATVKSLGFSCPLYVMHPGYGVRNNLNRADNGWRENFARGQDFTRQISLYKNDPQVWPWCTWLGGYDGYLPNTVDSDQAAWKKVYATAVARGKHYLLGGENTGGEDNSGLDTIMADAFGPAPASGPIYADGRPQRAWEGFHQMMWLNYSDLVAGGSHATMAHYASQANTYR